MKTSTATMQRTCLKTVILLGVFCGSNVVNGQVQTGWGSSIAPLEPWPIACSGATCDLSPPNAYGCSPCPNGAGLNWEMGCCHDQWHFSSAGIVLGRSRPARVWTTYETNNNPNQLMNTQGTTPNWQGGGELHIGRSFDCGTWTIDLGYWSIDELRASANQNHVNSVSTPLLFHDLEFGFGDPVQDYFDSAEEHRLARRNRLHNVELNIVEECVPQNGYNRWTCRKLVGVRFFRFDENLALSTLDLGGVWGGNSGLDEAMFEDSVENQLVGTQIGCYAERRFGCRARLFVTPKLGIYNNRIEHRFHLCRGDGTAAAPSAFSGVVGNYPIESATDVVAFLTEFSFGGAWEASEHWSIFGGYRVIVASGVGGADEQIPQYMVDIPEIVDIDHTSALVLQGAFFGITCAL